MRGDLPFERCKLFFSLSKGRPGSIGSVKFLFAFFFKLTQEGIANLS